MYYISALAENREMGLHISAKKFEKGISPSDYRKREKKVLLKDKIVDKVAKSISFHG